ncbi:MAG: hypothetical protein ACFE95_05035 [Candidatus Hodarchaeota archaeon]
MNKRIILLIVLSLGIAALFFSSPSLQSSAMLGDDFFEDFEDPFSGWNATGLWHLENNTQSAYFTWVPSDYHYMWYGDNITGNYDNGSTNSGSLTSDPIDLTYMTGIIELGFWSCAETQNIAGVDEKEVQISDDGGITWYSLGEVDDSTDWEYYSFNITNYWYSSNVHIRFFFDTVDSSDNNYRGWMIDDVEIKEKPGHFDLQIHQGRYALEDDNRKIDFYIYSYFDQDMNVDIEILITPPSGINNESLYTENSAYIDRWSHWYYSYDYTFKEEGLYQVHLIATDQYGKKWWTDCWWEIGPYFDLWIDQKNYALQYEEREIYPHIHSHYDYGMNVDIFLEITTPSGVNDTIYTEYDVYIPANEDWRNPFLYNFTEEGSYQVYLTIIDQDGKKWWTECWWEIGPHFDIWIEQDQDARIGEEKWMKFHVDSKFAVDMTVNITIMIELQSWQTDILHEESRINIPAWGSWEKELTYKFNETGHHHAKLEVVNMTGHRWDNWCCWNINEAENIFELWIDQENYAEVDEERSMYFKIESFFDHGMDIEIKITIVRPDGTEELLHQETTYIPAFGLWEYSHSYVFQYEGYYDVYLTVVDYNEKEWQADCWWKVGDVDDEPSDDQKSDDGQITPGFEGILIFGALAMSTILIRRRRM